MGAVITYIVLLSGAYVVNVDATAACTTWPGCSAAPIPFIDGGFEQHIHWLHRFIVVGGLLAVLGVFLAVTGAEERGSGLRRGGHAVLGLYGLQILVGASNIWTDFSVGARVAHLAVGATIWAVLVLMLVAGRYQAGEATSVAAPEGSGVTPRQPARA